MTSSDVEYLQDHMIFHVHQLCGLGTFSHLDPPGGDHLVFHAEREIMPTEEIMNCYGLQVRSDSWKHA